MQGGDSRLCRLYPGKPDHFPDAAFMTAKQIVFVEIELSKKATFRYERLAQIYSRPKRPDRIVYFYRGESLFVTLKDQLGPLPNIGLFPYSDPLPSPESLEGFSNGRNITLADFLSHKQEEPCLT